MPRNVNEPSEFGFRRGQPYGAGTSGSDEYLRQRAEIREADAAQAKADRIRRERVARLENQRAQRSR